MISYNRFNTRNIYPVTVFWFWLAGWSMEFCWKWKKYTCKYIFLHLYIHTWYNTIIIIFIQKHINLTTFFDFGWPRSRALRYVREFTLVTKWRNSPEWHICNICQTRDDFYSIFTCLMWFLIHVNLKINHIHYNDVIMSTMASLITSVSIVYPTLYSAADQRKYQSSVLLAFVRGIHRRPVNSPHKGSVTRKMFPFDDVIMLWRWVHMFLTSGKHSFLLALTVPPELNVFIHIGIMFSTTYTFVTCVIDIMLQAYIWTFSDDGHYVLRNNAL